MEQGFFLAKELHIPWSDIERMESVERNWLYERLIEWSEDQEKEYKAEMAKAKSGGGGRGIPVTAFNT